MARRANTVINALFHIEIRFYGLTLVQTKISVIKIIYFCVIVVEAIMLYRLQLYLFIYFPRERGREAAPWWSACGRGDHEESCSIPRRGCDGP